jgi:hypothetical protein
MVTIVRTTFQDSWCEKCTAFYPSVRSQVPQQNKYLRLSCIGLTPALSLACPLTPRCGPVHCGAAAVKYASLGAKVPAKPGTPESCMQFFHTTDVSPPGRVLSNSGLVHPLQNGGIRCRLMHQCRSMNGGGSVCVLLECSSSQKNIFVAVRNFIADEEIQ